MRHKVLTFCFCFFLNASKTHLFLEVDYIISHVWLSSILVHFHLWPVTLEYLCQLLSPKVNRRQMKVKMIWWEYETYPKPKVKHMHVCLLISVILRLGHNCEICILFLFEWGQQSLLLLCIYLDLYPKKCFIIIKQVWWTHLQALTLTQMVLTSSVVVSSSINTPRWPFTNLRHKDFNRPIWSQMDNSFDFITWQKEEKTQSHIAAASLPPLHAVCVPVYFTSAVEFFPRTLFTLFKAHLHAQHKPGS